MTKPFVFVHGAWHGAWCYQKLVDLLKEHGVEATAVNLPLQGTTGDINEARNCISSHPGAVVVGHSYGGLVITHASLGRDVSHLVYLCALMPDQGENVNEAVSTAPPATALEQAMVVNADGTIGIDPELASAAFYDDCDPVEAADAVSRLRSQVFEPFPILDQKAPWREIPSTYVICQDDKALHPELQRKFAERAGNVVELPGAHSPFMSRPGEVAELLLELAN